ncbi:MAG: hypothetical protein IJ874_08530 [Ruminococcus sp.]|nr:hypothetical protein [Ruminococcus sp.]
MILTILKIIGIVLLVILLVILALVLIVLLLPVRAEAAFIDRSFTYRIRLWFIPVMDSSGGGIAGWLKKRRDKGKKEEPPEHEDMPDMPEGENTDDIKPPDSSDNAEKPAAETLPDEEPQAEEPAETAEAAEKPETAEADDTEQPDEIAAMEELEADEAEKEDKPGKSLGEKIEFILDIWRAADRPLLKIFKGFRLYDLYIDFITADEDAYKCAMKYGRICQIVYPLLGWLSTLFTVRLKTVDINPGFALEKSESRWDAAVKLSFRAGTAVLAGLWFAVTYVFRYFIPAKLRERKLKKLNLKRQK